jgi:hypothetical protein
MRSKSELLTELNADLPAGIDWHAGAIKYLDTYFKTRPRHAAMSGDANTGIGSASGLIS